LVLVRNIDSWRAR
jgi:hypothetical protein